MTKRALYCAILSCVLPQITMASDSTMTLTGRRGFVEGTVTGVEVRPGDGGRATLSLSWSTADWLAATSFPLRQGDLVPIAGTSYEVTSLIAGQSKAHESTSALGAEPDHGQIDLRRIGPVGQRATRQSYVIASKSHDAGRPLVFTSQSGGWDVRVFLREVEKSTAQGQIASLLVESGKYGSKRDLSAHIGGDRQEYRVKVGDEIMVPHVGRFIVDEVLESDSRRPGWVVLTPAAN